MRVHHLNCVSLGPLGGRPMEGIARSDVQRRHLAFHCQPVETDRGPVPIDTGFGLRDLRDPRGSLSAFCLGLLSPQVTEEPTAVRQIRRPGLQPGVRHILPTHLDFDHAGGLDDFPEATVHPMEPEREGAAAQKTWLDRQRLRLHQWSTRANWRVYRTDSGERWLGFERVGELEGMPPERLVTVLCSHDVTEPERLAGLPWQRH